LGERISFFLSTFLVECKGTAAADLGSVERYERDRREYNWVFDAGEGRVARGRYITCQ
jgi:hypothetical protein